MYGVYASCLSSLFSDKSIRSLLLVLVACCVRFFPPFSHSFSPPFLALKLFFFLVLHSLRIVLFYLSYVILLIIICDCASNE